MKTFDSRKHIGIIGSGFSGLSSACILAKEGQKVTIYEKNQQVGGRARLLQTNGFTFDMGPSWYWMPDVFEKFFNRFGKTTENYFQLKKLSPSYNIIFSQEEVIKVPDSMEEIFEMFESIESGSRKYLSKFLENAHLKYQLGVNQLVYKPSKSLFEFFQPQIISNIFRLSIFQSYHSYVRKYFKDPHLISLLEFPLLFLGASAKRIPALYSLMNHASLSLGTWYPMGGMHEIIKAMKSLAEELGVTIHTKSTVEKIMVKDKKAYGLLVNQNEISLDAVIASADYHFVEQNLLKNRQKKYSKAYWNKRTLAPSSLVFYLGVKEKIPRLNHHNLFFDEDLEQHSKEIYETPQWPTRPLFYVCCPSKTDNSVAPIGMENLFILMPLAPGLEDTKELREKYFHLLMNRLEKFTGKPIRNLVMVKKSYAIKDFKQDYNAYKGNAYGLANTLKQTAIFKPSMHNPNVKNLIYTGQLTVPGPGVPPAIISGQVAANEIMKILKIKS
ncbi:phytoene desaturase family protein [Xanthovirga aplysinae]|uniref:phytoene desaturase family protein n=1 Tax=Xanthovirga aplysinae TaxID=2529853 RepID=UPI0012BC20ED|nr:phytoene desaturase family protein [Xanthovirga aplysinae]MTI33498.1 phytoene desaturase [Xanthovirga aplysinae]